MATVEECARALHSLAERLADIDADTRGRYLQERTISCRVRDLDVIFAGRLGTGGLSDVREAPDASAQVRLSTTSDDLVALADGRLSVPSAWATGRLKIEASVLDLLRLRSLL